MQAAKVGGPSPDPNHPPSNTNPVAGGKVKPLKAPKKEKKEMDEDEIAFKAKQAAGMLILSHVLDRGLD